MRLLAAATVATLLLAGCSTTATESAATHSGAQAHATAKRTHSRSSRTTSPSGSTDSSGLATCALDSLPPQAQDTAHLIVSGGPFPYRRNDGVTYFNRNGVLPQRARGVYREFTVRTPGASNRGTRRIITDGNQPAGAPTTTPSAWYYTGDHYDSFCRITGTP